MTNPAANFLAGALYLGAGVALLWNLLRDEPTARARRTALLVAAAAVALHALSLYAQLQREGGVNLALTGAFALVAWAVTGLYLLAALWRPVDNLGVIILPLAALTVLVQWWWPGARPMAFSSSAQAVHIVTSIAAYSLLCLAAVQGVMLSVQEQRLRRRQPQGFIRSLPPMQTMEETMFQMIGIGFALLTVTLVSGVFFSERLFGTPFKFTHHMLLAALGWVVYAILLLGRWHFGWRGRTAVRWTLGGFALLVLAYFGSKFVIEVILAR